MNRHLIALLLFSQNAFSFTQVQVSAGEEAVQWQLIGTLALLFSLISAIAYLWLLNRRLLKSKHKLSVIWHHIPDVLTEVDADGIICAVNQPLSNDFAIEDVVGTSSYDYLSESDCGVFRDSLRKSLTEGVEVEYELVAILGDDKRFLNNRIIPLTSTTDEIDARALVITSDITHHKEASRILQQAKIQAEDNAQSKADFLARMSHEIRTPLGGIIGMANLLNDDGLKGDIQQYSEPLLSSANHLQQIVDDVLDLAKTDSGEIELDESDTSLWHIFDDLEALYAPQAVNKHVTLSINLSSDIPRYIRADAFRLRQVLYNLFSNAIKFTAEGSITLNVSRQQIVENQVLKFTVKDTGIGVPEDSQKNIFDAFTQANGQVAQRFGGTGLGLSICRNLVEIMGGVIGVESAVNEGAEFWFTLPLKVVNQDKDYVSQGFSAALVIKNDIKRKWFERFLQTVQIDFTVFKEGEQVGQSSIDGFSLLITDCVLDAEADHLWWVGVDYDLSNAHGVILHEPYRREALLNRISGYITSQGAELLSDEYAGQPNINYANAMNGRSNNSESNVEATSDEPSGMVVPGNLLVVEDNLTNQMVIKKTLEKMGYHVSVANNGEEGVASFLSETYQGVIMDVQMPVMDGIEATRQIRQVEEQYVPIIALTANAKIQ